MKAQRLVGDRRGVREGGDRDQVPSTPLATMQTAAVGGARIQDQSTAQDKLEKGRARGLFLPGRGGDEWRLPRRAVCGSAVLGQRETGPQGGQLDGVTRVQDTAE
ncbi:hypothetical protein NDU88_003276 [Pleurodeles waltl]|uniref:Uncharacterized protein n=1 Tax=Pleurodeles waltl TaxID=8319 RepID=A0AAV7LI43_PLEWA|nr:hypothetical protein NDU88_003276 [Pleurodeles waltl]